MFDGGDACCCCCCCRFWNRWLSILFCCCLLQILLLLEMLFLCIGRHRVLSYQTRESKIVMISIVRMKVLKGLTKMTSWVATC